MFWYIRNGYLLSTNKQLFYWAWTYGKGQDLFGMYGTEEQYHAHTISDPWIKTLKIKYPLSEVQVF